MKQINFPALGLLALLAAGTAFIPALSHAQEAGGDPGVSDGSDGSGDPGTDPVGSVDDGTGDDGVVTADGSGDEDYDPVIAQSGVPESAGADTGSGTMSSRSDYDSARGGHIKRSLFGSNSPFGKWFK